MLDARNFDSPGFLAVLPLFSDIASAERKRLPQGWQLRRFERGDRGLTGSITPSCSAGGITNSLTCPAKTTWKASQALLARKTAPAAPAHRSVSLPRS